jgi:antitoxin Phd
MPSSSPQRSRATALGRWPLQQAKAHFLELVRKAREEGPQHVTVNGRESVVVLSEEEYSRLTGHPSGKLLVELLRASPLADVALEHDAVRGSVRRVDP